MCYLFFHNSEENHQRVSMVLIGWDPWTYLVYSRTLWAVPEHDFVSRFVMAASGELPMHTYRQSVCRATGGINPHARKARLHSFCIVLATSVKVMIQGRGGGGTPIALRLVC